MQSNLRTNEFRTQSQGTLSITGDGVNRQPAEQRMGKKIIAYSGLQQIHEGGGPYATESAQNLAKNIMFKTQGGGANKNFLLKSL